MTLQEAIRILHPDTTAEALAEIEYYAGFSGHDACIKAVEEACVIACEAMGKQIPKKPREVDKDNGYFVCHSCGEGIYSSDEFETHKFCLNCGQAIDWEDNG